MDFRSAPLAGGAERFGRIFAGIDHRIDGGAGGDQLGGRAPARVGAGENADPGCRRDREAVDIAADRRSLHDPWPVVAAKRDRPLVGPGRDHTLPGDNLPKPLARSEWLGFGTVVRDTFERGVGGSVIGGEHRGAGHNRNPVHACQPLGAGGGPFGSGRAVDLVPLGKQPPPHAEILLAEDHPRACLRSAQGGHQARGSGTDHQHVAEGMALLVAVRVWQAAGPA